VRILILSHRFSPFVGGIEVNSELLADEFNKLGHEVRVMTWTATGKDIVFPYVVIRKPGLFQMFKQMLWADLVLENNPCIRLAWPVLLMTKKIHGIVLCTWVRRSDGSLSWLDRFKIWWIAKADRVIAVSESVRKQACLHATVIGNPYRDKLFRNMLIQRDKDFVFVGRLVSDKGVDMAVRMLKELLNINSGRDLSLTIIGEGPEKEKLINLVTELGLNRHVYFAGTLRGDELVKCINRHKYFVVPSRWEEPFGNVALEGMACGCIPIVSDGGGLPDAVGAAGLIFERNNLDDLVLKAGSLLQDSALYERLHREVLEHLNKYKADVVAKRYLEFLNN